MEAAAAEAALAAASARESAVLGRAKAAVTRTGRLARAERRRGGRPQPRVGGRARGPAERPAARPGQRVRARAPGRRPRLDCAGTGVFWRGPKKNLDRQRLAR